MPRRKEKFLEVGKRESSYAHETEGLGWSDTWQAKKQFEKKRGDEKRTERERAQILRRRSIRRALLVFHEEGGS